MNDHERIMDHEQRFKIAADEFRSLQEEIKKLKLENLDLSDRLKTALDIQIQTQPILGRMIAACCILERKGVYNVGELNQIQEKQAEAFCKAANKAASGEMPNRPDQDGTVANDSGNGRSGLSGSQSVGGDSTGDTVHEDRPRARITRLSDVRAARSAGDGTPDVGTSETKNLPSGQE